MSLGLDKVRSTMVEKPLNWLSNTKLSNWSSKHHQANNMKVITGIGVFSIVAKDGYGCYLYVKQSLENKKIPDDKRKFVAALDLANGGLMILMQLLMYFTISHKVVQSKMFDKMFGKFFDRPVTKSYQTILKNKDKLSGMTGKQFHTSFEKYRKSVKDSFGYLSSLVAATILGKRVIVPFIATPLADKTKAWMCRNDKPAEVHKETINTYNTKEAPAKEVEKKEAVTKIQNLNQQPKKNSSSLLPDQNVEQKPQVNSQEQQETNLLAKVKKGK